MVEHWFVEPKDEGSIPFSCVYILFNKIVTYKILFLIVFYLRRLINISILNKNVFFITIM